MGDRTVELNGVRIDRVSNDRLIAAVASFVESGDGEVVHFIAAHATVLARSDPEYRRILNAAALNVPDGVGVVWGLRLLGHRVRNITGTDGLRMLCRWSVDHGLRHYLLGSAPSVVDQLRVTLERSYPGIQVAGAESTRHGALTEWELQEAGDRMRRSEADLVWVGLGTPRQDLAAERLKSLAGARVILCVGAAFDFVSGTKRRAPRWMQRAGLEWLHRVAMEPSRLWRRYLVGNTRFALGVGHDALRSKLR